MTTATASFKQIAEAATKIPRAGASELPEWEEIDHGKRLRFYAEQFGIQKQVVINWHTKQGKYTAQGAGATLASQQLSEQLQKKPTERATSRSRSPRRSLQRDESPFSPRKEQEIAAALPARGNLPFLVAGEGKTEAPATASSSSSSAPSSQGGNSQRLLRALRESQQLLRDNQQILRALLQQQHE
mmetsp:Transcript_26913/g.67790  ORF Transcript_26913/g.67790 Transcript_26913/m.67790 type:complete len:186 (+) Transcript_26913:1481-2038(+)